MSCLKPNNFRWKIDLLDSPPTIYLSIYLSIYLMAEVVRWAVFNSAPTMIDGTMDDDES